MQVEDIRTRWRAFLVLPLLVLALWAVYPTLQHGYVSVLGWIHLEKRGFHTTLSDNVGQLAKHGNPSTALALIVGSFLYGVFHAVGPGHGKVLLTTYLLSS
jgi:nickel/cobalt exporter